MDKMLKKLKPVFNFLKASNAPILKSVLISEGCLRLTDFEIMLEIKDDFNLENGLHPWQTIGLSGCDKSLSIKDFPAFDFALDPVYTLNWSQKGIESFLPFISKDETRLYLNSVAVHDSHIVATDGHALKYLLLEKVSKFNYIMPAASLVVLNKLLKKYKIKDAFTVNLNEEFMLIENMHFIFKAKLLQREYPNWQAIIPPEFVYEFSINAWLDIKELKPLFNRDYAIKIELKKGIVWAGIDGHDKKYEIGICSKDIRERTIGFNALILDKCINKSTTIAVKFNSVETPFGVNGHICMPRRIKKKANK